MVALSPVIAYRSRVSAVFVQVLPRDATATRKKIAAKAAPMTHFDSSPVDDNRRILSLITSGQPMVATLLVLAVSVFLFQATAAQSHSALTIVRGGPQGDVLSYTAGGWRQGAKTVEIPLADVREVQAKQYNRNQRGTTGQVLVKTPDDATMVFNGDYGRATLQADALKAFLADPARKTFAQADDNSLSVLATMAAALLLLVPGLLLFPFRGRRVMLERTPEALRIVSNGKASEIAWDDIVGLAHDTRNGRLALDTRSGEVTLLPVPLLARLIGPTETSRRRSEHVERRVQAFLEPVRVAVTA